MTHDAKLTLIAAKCRKLLAYAESNVTDLYGGCAIAGWSSTLAAIEALRDMGEHDAYILSANILAAWPDELF